MINMRSYRNICRAVDRVVTPRQVSVGQILMGGTEAEVDVRDDHPLTGSVTPGPIYTAPIHVPLVLQTAAVGAELVTGAQQGVRRHRGGRDGFRDTDRLFHFRPILQFLHDLVRVGIRRKVEIDKSGSVWV